MVSPNLHDHIVAWTTKIFDNLACPQERYRICSQAIMHKMTMGDKTVPFEGSHPATTMTST